MNFYLNNTVVSRGTLNMERDDTEPEGQKEDTTEGCFYSLILEWRMETYLNDSPLTHELTIQLILACYSILSLLLENIFPLVLSSFCVSLLPSDNDHLDETTVHHLSLDLICIHTSIAIGFSFLYLHKTEIVFLLFLSLTIHTFKKKYLSLNLFHSDFEFR